jgi:hypothetical protein
LSRRQEEKCVIGYYQTLLLLLLLLLLLFKGMPLKAIHYLGQVAGVPRTPRLDVRRRRRRTGTKRRSD